MTIAHYTHTCTQCDKTYKKEQAWIDPSQFSNSKQSILTTTFWCPKCDRGQALKIKMLPEQKITIEESLVYGQLMNEKSPSYYVSSKDKGTEAQDIKVITEEKALEILSGLD